MNDALVYLTVRSIHNSILLRLRRLRQPRYLLVGLALVLYCGSTIFSRSQSGGFRIPAAYESLARMTAAVLFFVVMAASWVLPATAALRFTPPEINVLFPAPIARRHLLGYKIGRLCLGVMGAALFFTIVIGPTRPAAAALFALKTTVVMSVLGLYEAGVSLYRINARASSGARARIRIPVLLAWVALMTLTAWALAVFAFASGTGELLRMVPVIALLFFACVAWILRSDAAFEEEAALNADKMQAALQRIQRGQPRITSRRDTPFALATRGPVETAILWKNWLLFGRASKKWMVGVVPFLLIFIGTGVFAGGSSAEWEMVPFFLLIIAGAVALIGPQMVRADLRRDLAHLVLIKTWPVTGAAIVRGEVLAPAIALSLGTLAALLPGGLLVEARVIPAEGTVSGRLVFIGAAAISAAATILAQLLIQNAIAVTFPAWIRMRPGVESMGQALVVMYGGLFVLGLAALVPLGAAAAVLFLAGGVLLPAGVYSVLMLIECFAASEIIGRVLERTDVQDTQ